VAVVHRPRHGDWSLPKGKLDPGEDFETAALREIHEECCLRCELGEELPTSRYTVGDTPKVVRWWRMSVVADEGFAPNEEVDELRWLAPGEATELLSYKADRVLVEQASRRPTN
jgi:8-oxo-dGTP pyrophosphatase MutT (NUDIX family)